MITYRKSGVDIKASDEFTKHLSKKFKYTGGFSGLFPLKETAGRYSIAASTDGVGTKLKLAFLLGKHDTVGIDLVAMCANDIVACGAAPSFFLDYYATGKLELATSKKIIKGIGEGCRRAGCVLLGGETAEMPGFYPKGEYDLAGFAVGFVKTREIVDGSKIKNGDVLIGLKSSGFHSNGYSLLRKVLKEKNLLRKYARRLLAPTRIYVKDILKLRKILKKKGGDILGAAHITGGGIEGNLKRILPGKVSAAVYRNSWRVPPLMREIQKIGNIPEKDMWRTFNMGLGMILAVRKKDSPAALKILKGSAIIGEITKGKEKVAIK